MEHKEMLVRAYELAYYIHCRKDVAKTIAFCAMLNLDTSVDSQADRDRHPPLHHRTKVKLYEAHLLQRNVFVESEIIEKQQERGFAEASLTQVDMLIRYVKFLVKETGNCNAYNVLVCLTGLLYSYNNDEVFRQQAFLSQSVDGVKDDAYFRKRKSWYVGRLKKRFAVVDEGLTGTPPYLELIATGDSGQGGASPIGRQKRFRWLPERAEYAQVIRDSLNQFQPWDVECFLPASFDPDDLNAIDLLGGGDEAEIYRIHILLHQACFEKMIRAFDFAAPDKSLKAPRFFLGVDELKPSGGDRKSPPPLDSSEINELISVLSLHSKKRRRITGGFFKFVVDGGVVGVLDGSGEGRLVINIPGGHDILKVIRVADSEEMQLASYLFDPNILDDTFTIKLENRRQIVVTINQSEAESVDDDAPVELNISLQRKKSSLSLKDKLAWLKTGTPPPGDTSNRSAQNVGLLGFRLPVAGLIQAAFLFAVIAVIALAPRTEWQISERLFALAELRNDAGATTDMKDLPIESVATPVEKPDIPTRPSKVPSGPRKSRQRPLQYQPRDPTDAEKAPPRTPLTRNERNDLTTQCTEGEPSPHKLYLQRRLHLTVKSQCPKV